VCVGCSHVERAYYGALTFCRAYAQILRLIASNPRLYVCFTWQGCAFCSRSINFQQIVEDVLRKCRLGGSRPTKQGVTEPLAQLFHRTLIGFGPRLPVVIR